MKNQVGMPAGACLILQQPLTTSYAMRAGIVEE
jgi:hypothetical protein